MPVQLSHQWQSRNPQRLADAEWEAVLARVRSEFDEMPCLRVTSDQARALFGLSRPSSDWILNRLTDEGFLAQTPDGQYVRRNARP
jgi:hypothetical protein